MKKIKKLFTAAIITTIGLILLKFIPMQIFGSDILFDASSHVAITFFVLYFIWMLIEHNKDWKIPYIILSCSIIVILSIQRIIVGAHNEIGILLGIGIGVISIMISEDMFKKKFKF